MVDKTLFEARRLPARLDVCQVALLLGFQEYEICILMRVKLLRPLGAPKQNGHKFFCSTEILQLATDRDWLDKATRTVTKCVQEKGRKPKDEKGFATTCV
jgi:hypothetical protein